MKTQLISTLTVIGTLIAAATINADVALSPRAAANQIRIVPSHGDLDFARVQLGEAARAKSSGDFSVVISGGIKDVDLVHGRSNLGIAAKAKATGVGISSRDVQLAPLK